MADETNPSSAAETAVASQAAPAKKQRAPRAKKAEAAPAASAEPAKKNRGGRPKRAAAEATPVAATAPTGQGKRGASAAPTAAKRGPNRASKVSTAVSPLADDLADLLQLEEENKRLRQSLAEKLRAENSDLRSRLGLK